MSCVPKIDHVFVRHQLTDGLCHRESSDATVKYSYWVFRLVIQRCELRFKENKKPRRWSGLSKSFSVSSGHILRQGSKASFARFAMIAIVALIVFHQQSRFSLG